MSGIFDQIINYSPPLIVSGTVNYKGTWNASTNNPTLNSSPASSTKGDYYVVSTAGTQFGITFAIGDWIISNGTAWEKVDLTDAVSSVFGRTGAVVGVSTDYSAVGITNTAIGVSNPSTGAFTTVSATTPIAGTSGGTGVNNGANTITIAGNVTHAGAFTQTFTATANTALTLPTTGTLATLAGSEALSNKTITASAFNGTVGATTPSTGAFTTLSASDNSSVTKSTNGATSFSISNVNTGTSAFSAYYLSNSLSTSRASVTLSGGSYSPVVGWDVQDSLGLTNNGAGGISIVSRAGGSSSIRNYIGDGTAAITTVSSTGLAVTGSIGAKSGGALQLWDSANADYAYINNTGSSAATQLISYYSAGSGSVAHQFKTYSGGVVNALAITPAGNVGIGTTSPSYRLDVRSLSTATAASFSSTNTTAYSATSYNGGAARMFISTSNATGAVNGIEFTTGGNNEAFFGVVQESGGAGAFVFQGYTGAAYTERMRIDSSGNVGIGTSSPGTTLDVQAANASLRVYGTGASDTPQFQLRNGSQIWQQIVDGADSNKWKLRTGAGTAVLNCDTSGNVGIGNTAPTSLLALSNGSGAGSDATSTGTLQIRQVSTGLGNGGGLEFHASTYGAGYGFKWSAIDNSGVHLVLGNRENSATWTERLRVNSTGLAVTGTLSCTGALSKGSGSFRIEHPLPEKSATHQLVHSFIEGPQADLIYRGKVVLVDGKASVNIDAAATMSEGTFEVLCREVQCFTTNETGWTAVRGKVTGNILTIEAKDADCADEISWMVIGERKDPHMMETDWTDDSGKVIVEPLKPVQSIE